MEYHFELFRARNGNNKIYFWWRVRSSNWKILLTSETYTTKNACLKVMRKLITKIGVGVCDFEYIDKT
jgi:uncharacterized protein YegP (UPF0339 family)